MSKAAVVQRAFDTASTWYRALHPHSRIARHGPIVAVDALESRQLLSATYFVSTSGVDSNPGSIDAPFRTIQHAASVAAPGDTVDIRGGTYHETVSPARSGSAGAPITFQSCNGEHVVIDGADAVTGWSNYSGAIYQANNPADLGFGNNQVFVNGQAVSLASWPSAGLSLSHPKLATVQSGGGSLTDDALLTSGVNWTGGTIHIISGQGWVSQTATITSQSGNRITFNLGRTVDPHGGIQPGNKYYLTGKLSALNSPGEFYVGSGSVYLWTPDSSNPNSDSVEVKRRLYGFNLNGKSYINIQGINLFSCTIVANGANSIHIDSISAQYLSQFVVASNGWQPGNNSGIVLNGSNNSITNSVIAYSAGDGILVLGHNNVIQNNIVHDCDYSATDTAGIRTWGSGDTISYNTIYNTGRDGIKFSSTTNTQVTHNLVHDVMLQTTDGGGIYTYGTNGSGSQIAYNKVYSVHSGGWGAAGLYLDNGSSNFSVHNNNVTNVDIGIKMNPTSYNEKIVDNTLVAGMQSVASYGSQNMSGSQFIGNVFNAALMIKGSVTMSGNVASGDTAGSFSAGASIGDTLSASSAIFRGAIAAIPAGGAAPLVTIPAMTPAATATASPAAAVPAMPAVATTPAQKLQADLAQLTGDRQALSEAIAALKARDHVTEAADLQLIAADLAQIRHDRHDKSLLAADRAKLAADRLKLRADIVADREDLARSKAQRLAQIKTDLLQQRTDKKALAKAKTSKVRK